MDSVTEVLMKLKGLGSTSQQIAFRCSLIFQYLKRKHLAIVAEDLGCHWVTAQKWINRWESQIPKVLENWHRDGYKREDEILQILQDAKRSGAPPTYTDEQVVQIVALACRKPAEFGRPITHWSMRELAAEVVNQKIATSISETTLRRFLISGRSQTAQKPLLVESKNRRSATFQGKG